MHFIGHLIHAYGLLTVAAVVGLECIGFPLPGETALLAAAMYAGTKHDLNIVSIILTAAAAASIGRTIGYGIGYEFHWLLLRYGNYVRMTEGRIKLGEYLFLRHGGKIVAVAQFVPVLRTLAGVFAGLNVMPWRHFLFTNVTGSLVWALTYGYAAYALGRQFERFQAPLVIVFGLITVAALTVGAIFVHRHESQLIAEAERALPGPLKSIQRKATWRRVLRLSS
jgi:membrane protein DedA with SNARE-associated domain